MSQEPSDAEKLLNSFQRTDIEERWRVMDRDRKLFFLLWLGFVPFAAAVFALTTSFDSLGMAVVLVFFYLSAFSVTSKRLLKARCPYCDEKAFGKKRFPLSLNCDSCEGTPTRPGDPINVVKAGDLPLPRSTDPPHA